MINFIRRIRSKITGRQSVKDAGRAGKNFLYMGVPKYIAFVFEFFASVYVARELGPESYGILATVYAFVTLFRFLPDMGSQQIILRDVAQDRSRAEPYLGNAVMMRLSLSVLSVILINAVTLLIDYPSDVRYYIAIYSIILVTDSIALTPFALSIAHERFRLTGGLDLIKKILISGAAPLALLAGYKLGGVLWFSLVAALLTCSSFVIINRQLGVRFHLKPDFKIIRMFFLQGYPIALSACFYVLSTKIDRIMLSKMLTMEDVGQYNISAKIMLISMEAFWAPVANIVFPLMSRSYKQSVALMTRKTVKYAVFLFLVYAALSLFFTLFGRQIITFVWGPEYEPAFRSLCILIWATIFISLTQLLYRALIVLKAQKLYLAVQMAAAVANIIMNYWLIPIWGIAGAATATIVSSGVAFFFCLAVATSNIRKRSSLEPDQRT